MATKKPDPVEPESTEVAVREATGVPARSEDFISQYVRTDIDDPEATAAATHRAIIEEILASRSVDDALNVPDPQAMAELVGQHLVLHGYRVQESEFEEGPPVYFTLNLTNGDTDDKIIVNTGEQAVMAQVLVLDRENAFPIHLTVKQARKPNRFNRYPVRFTRMEA